MQSELTKSFSSANTAAQYPQYSDQIINAAKTSFLEGADWAYTAGIVAIVLGAALVYFRFPAATTNNACWRSTRPPTRDGGCVTRESGLVGVGGFGEQPALGGPRTGLAATSAPQHERDDDRERGSR